MDTASVLARIAEIAERSRQAELEAREAGHHTAAARARDGELRALQALTGMGVDHEGLAKLAADEHALYRAATLAARSDPSFAATLADELEAAGRYDQSDDLREQISKMKEVSANEHEHEH